MEPYSSTTVFVDVEHGSDRFLLPQEMCRNLIPQVEKDTTINTHMFASGASQTQLVTQTSPVSLVPSHNENVPTTSQSVPITCQNVPTTSQSEVLKAKQSGTRKSTDKAEPEALAPVPRRIRCPECQRYTAESEEKMLRHIKKVHKGENPFQCYMCDYSTYNKSLFEEHVRIHQGIKPFKCSQCVYRSASKKNLKKHELIHRPNNPLKCKQCDFIARHPRALKRHEETHSGANGLKFDSCKFQFQDMAAFRKHERTHKFKCKECDFKSCSRPFLKRHMGKEHGVVDENVKRESFNCQVCGWTSSTMAKILLHLIHHPKQEVDENVIDVSILRKHGIMA